MILDEAIQYCEEVQSRDDLCTSCKEEHQQLKEWLEEYKVLKERATPKKPIKDEPSKMLYVPTYVCPNCGGGFSGRLAEFCYHCGQALKWGDE